MPCAGKYTRAYTAASLFIRASIGNAKLQKVLAQGNKWANLNTGKGAYRNGGSVGQYA